MSYAESKRLNQSTLKDLKKALDMHDSEEQAWAYFLKMKDKKIITEAMIDGTYFHMMILEPEKWNKLAEVKSSRGGGSVASWREAGKVVLTQTKWDLFQKAKNNLYENAEIRQYLELIGTPFVEVEKEIEFEIDGVEMKGKLDYYTDGLILDLKKVENVSPRKLSYTVIDYGYHIQHYIYSKGIVFLTGELPEFKFITCELTGNCECRLITLSRQFWERAETEVWYLLNVWNRWKDVTDVKYLGYPSMEIML